MFTKEMLAKVLLDPLFNEKAKLVSDHLRNTNCHDIQTTVVFHSLTKTMLQLDLPTAERQLWENYETGAVARIIQLLPKLTEGQKEELNKAYPPDSIVTPEAIMLKVQDWYMGQRNYIDLFDQKSPRFNKQGGQKLRVTGADKQVYSIDAKRSQFHTDSYKAANAMPPVSDILSTNMSGKYAFGKGVERKSYTVAALHSGLTAAMPAFKEQLFNKQGKPITDDSTLPWGDKAETVTPDAKEIVATSSVTQGCAKCGKMFSLDELKPWQPPTGTPEKLLGAIENKTGRKAGDALCSACLNDMNAAVKKLQEKAEEVKKELAEAEAQHKTAEQSVKALEDIIAKQPAIAEVMQPSLEKAKQAFNLQTAHLHKVQDKFFGKTSTPVNAAPAQQFGTQLSTVIGKANPTTAKQRRFDQHKQDRKQKKGKK